MWTLTDRSAPLSLLDYPAPAGAVIGAAFDHAIDTNPVPMFMQDLELQRAKTQGPILTQQQVGEEAARFGVSVSAPKEGMSMAATRILIQRRQDEAAFQLQMARSPGGFLVGGGQFAAGMAGSLLDPLNLAAGMIPVLNGTRYAAMLGTAATAGSRAGIRLGIGAAEGAVGAGLVELPTALLHRDLQDDYSLGDSLANIAFGTFASAGLRAGGGFARDAYLGLSKARQIDALRAIDPEVWAKMRDQAATAQERAFYSDLEQGFQRGEGIPEQLRQHFELGRGAEDFNARMGEYAGERAATAAAGVDAANALGNAMDFRYRESAQRILAAADEAINRRLARERDANLAAGMEPDAALKAAFQKVNPETEKLLTQAQIGQRRLNEMELADARRAIAEGRGMVFVPKTAAEAEAAISQGTHAAALRASVAQAVDGRPIDPTPIVMSDEIFGSRRPTQEQVVLSAKSNAAPENKVASNAKASRLAAAEIKAASTPKAERPEAGFGARVKAKASAAGAETPAPPVDNTPKSAEVIELETLYAAAEARLKAEGFEGNIQSVLDQQSDFEKAWKAVADCVEGKT